MSTNTHKEFHIPFSLRRTVTTIKMIITRTTTTAAHVPPVMAPTNSEDFLSLVPVSVNTKALVSFYHPIIYLHILAILYIIYHFMYQKAEWKDVVKRL